MPDLEDEIIDADGFRTTTRSEFRALSKLELLGIIARWINQDLPTLLLVV